MIKYYLYIGVCSTDAKYCHEVKMSDFWEKKDDAKRCLTILKFIYNYIMKGKERVK